ncbi:essential recombination function protein [Streptococcus acidominimus]|uniref:Essential recombination function protein n=1 Tax=Streptococcus acidominimus TaxID=1326 RepID=A0A239WZ24_STRAI|nr:ERF family protein [Streptococcus acidominimus]SNV39731.1 essential recombination function protein [Streptococcus acidominimus]
MTVYQKLLDVQSELKAPKNQRNTFGNYNYRSAEDIKEAVKPLLTKHKATILVDINILEKGNGWVYEEARAIFVDVETGDKVEVKGYAREPENKKGMDPSQISGSSNSYATKYALNGLLLLDDTKDADSDEYQEQVSQKSKTQPRKSPPKKISGAVATGYEAALKSVADKNGRDIAVITSWFLGKLKVHKLEDITEDQVTEASGYIERLQKGKEE